MATISSTGIGSGLDVNSIVSQLVALEKTPLKTLALKATNMTSQVSAFGDIKSQFSALTDVATRISAASAWGARTAASSNTSAATITATATANATNFSLDVDQLAQPQSVSSAQLTAGAAVGAGTLTLQLGTWTGTAFAQASNAYPPIDVDVNDTVATIAAKINAAGAGVVATSFNDGTGDRLLLRAKDTGVAAGFKLTVTETADDGNVATGLKRLTFDPSTLDPAITGAQFGMAAAGIPVQYGQDAKARINGLAVTSPSNTLTDNIPGVTIKLVATTTTGYDPAIPTGSTTEGKSPVTMSISEDVIPAVKNAQDFVTAYNKLNKTLADLTKYDAATKTAGLFQGDSSIVGLQNVLRNMLGSTSVGGTYQRLADVGLERQLDGSLSINTTKLSAAANNGNALQTLFTSNNGNALSNGFALKFRDLGRGVLASGGAVVTKGAALQGALTRNGKEQAKVNDHAALFEARLRKQYSALDAQMAQLNALNAYVTQQVASWNKSTA